ncbi:hypothetical protein ES332_D08G133000v1 [Gossypium tomentosum]|uniref:Uncharacterized protein n=1 Tax=Gossypium tomentosum TaxID=34277 RepID=A0A5D2JUL0_GOSTO|nr:hypothetical protein ES332_D08G133000v1 [Gossypium tomentosum]
MNIESGFSELIDTDRERHRARETANIIYFIMHKRTKHQQRNKELAPQKNREPAPAEDQRSSRGSKKQR